MPSQSTYSSSSTEVPIYEALKTANIRAWINPARIPIELTRISIRKSNKANGENPWEKLERTVET